MRFSALVLDVVEVSLLLLMVLHHAIDLVLTRTTGAGHDWFVLRVEVTLRVVELPSDGFGLSWRSHFFAFPVWACEPANIN